MSARRRKSKKQTSVEATAGILGSKEPWTKGFDNEEVGTEKRYLANKLRKN